MDRRRAQRNLLTERKLTLAFPRSTTSWQTNRMNKAPDYRVTTGGSGLVELSELERWTSRHRNSDER